MRPQGARLRSDPMAHLTEHYLGEHSTSMMDLALNKRVGKNIKEARKKRGLTQEALARQAGFTVSYIGRLEIGKHEPPLSTLARLAKILRVTLAQLVA